MCFQECCAKQCNSLWNSSRTRHSCVLRIQRLRDRASVRLVNLPRQYSHFTVVTLPQLQY